MESLWVCCMGAQFHFWSNFVTILLILEDYKTEGNIWKKHGKKQGLYIGIETWYFQYL